MDGILAAVDRLAGEGVQMMRGLSMKQPWAEMLIRGQKTIETRTWFTQYRGPIVICSSLQVDKAANLKFGHSMPKYSLGMAIGIFYLEDCRPMVPADEAAACFPCEPGRFAWITTMPTKRFSQLVPIKGRLGLFHLTPDEEHRVLQAAA